MAKGFKHGAGGSPLNFKVVAYATEELLMADTPKENTIGVITDTKITGWYFSFKQPENMTDGEVWFSSGETANVEFNALKKNDIQVYPNNAKQQVSGALVDVKAKIYQDGEWNDLIPKVYLYTLGDLCNSITGGWGQQKGTSGVVSWNASNVYLGYNTGDGRYSSIWTNSAINIDNHKKLCARISGLSISSDRFLFGVVNSPYTGKRASDAEGYFSAMKKFTASNSAEQIVEVDVSSFNGAYYVQLVAGITTVYVHEIYLE